jgi:hypothetical protein
MIAANIDIQSVAILLSRQALRPSGGSPWVRRSAEAVKVLTAENLTLCSSTGMLTWDLLTALGSINGSKMRLYIPGSGADLPANLADELCARFELNRSLVEFVGVTRQNTKEETLLGRDRQLINSANLLCPISLRPGGSMEKQVKKSDHMIRDEFITPYCARSGNPGYNLINDHISLEIGSIGDDHIIHWTRATNGCWPGEREIDLIRDILNSRTWPRDGYHTLRRIMRSKKLLASSRHMPGRARTVSFSGLPPSRMIPLMRWRARYRQMSFEPYGVGLRRGDAEKFGIRPVDYRAKLESLEESSAPRWLSQSIGRFANWRTEDEYRYPGDFDLAVIPDDRLILFCRTVEEAEALESEFGIRTIPFLT